MDNFGYLFAVYSIVWLVIFGFVLSLINRQNKLRKEINALKAMLAEKGLKEEAYGIGSRRDYCYINMAVRIQIPRD